ncbi:MAG: hypothetical protein IJJ68_08450 [Prevotella sp.]|nr:hypothetical protein [Prevotella sp.]
MKKIYIQPDTQAIALKVQNLLQTATGLNDFEGYGGPTNEGEADARSFFGLWEEEVVDKRNNDDFDDYEDEI